jgi:hypothetical protein
MVVVVMKPEIIASGNIKADKIRGDRPFSGFLIAIKPAVTAPGNTVKLTQHVVMGL